MNHLFADNSLLDRIHKATAGQMFSAGSLSCWIMGHVRAGQEVFVGEIKSAGFKVIGEEKFLKENYFVRFEKVVKEKSTTP